MLTEKTVAVLGMLLKSELVVPVMIGVILLPPVVLVNFLRTADTYG